MIPMPDPSEPARGARHAALLLHAMAPADRDWMLRTLPPRERAELEPLLAELEALGIERDPALIEAATTGSAQDRFDVQTPPPVAMSDETMLHALDDERVAVLARMLRAEPAGLVAEWLNLAAWPWRDAVLQAMEPMQRRRIEAHLAGMPVGSSTPPALRAMLVSTIADRLREPPLHEEPPATAWHRLRHSLAAVFQRPLQRRGALR